MNEKINSPQTSVQQHRPTQEQLNYLNSKSGKYESPTFDNEPPDNQVLSNIKMLESLLATQTNIISYLYERLNDVLKSTVKDEYEKEKCCNAENIKSNYCSIAKDLIRQIEQVRKHNESLNELLSLIAI